MCIARYSSQSTFTYVVRVSPFSLNSFYLGMQASPGLLGGLVGKAGRDVIAEGLKEGPERKWILTIVST